MKEKNLVMPSENSEKLEFNVAEKQCRKPCLEDEEKAAAAKDSFCHSHFGSNSVRSQNTIL